MLSIFGQESIALLGKEPTWISGTVSPAIGWVCGVGQKPSSGAGDSAIMGVSSFPAPPRHALPAGTRVAKTLSEGGEKRPPDFCRLGDKTT